MRRIAKAAALTGVGVLVARALAPRLKLHGRLMARCERMFQQMPEDFPPKRIMRGVDEIRVNTERTLALLEDEEREAGEAGQAGDGSSAVEALDHAS